MTRRSTSSPPSNLSVARRYVPAEWVIVDDGSTDRTGDIIDRYCGSISLDPRRTPTRIRGFRKSGGGVMEAFYDGYNTLQCKDWDFIVKLDGDLSFAPEYFEKCFEYFRRDPELGIGGGEIHHNIAGKIEARSKSTGSMCEARRRFIGKRAGKLLEDFGRPRDGTRSMKSKPICWAGRLTAFTDLHLLHHRFTGSEDGLLRDRVKHGVGLLRFRVSPPLCCWPVVCIGSTQKPYVLGSAAILYGFLKGPFYPSPRVEDQLIRRLHTRPAVKTSLWDADNLEVISSWSVETQSMCGICGKLMFGGEATVSPALVKAMADTISSSRAG